MDRDAWKTAAFALTPGFQIPSVRRSLVPTGVFFLNRILLITAGYFYTARWSSQLVCGGRCKAGSRAGMGSGRLCCRSRGWGLRVVSTQNSRRGAELRCLRGLEGPKFQRRGVLGAAQLSAPCPPFSVLLWGGSRGWDAPCASPSAALGPPHGRSRRRGVLFFGGRGIFAAFQMVQTPSHAML